MERHVRQWAFMQFMHILPTRSIKQIVMRIQITSLIIFIAFLNVAANVNGQNVTIKAKNATLTSVFNEIKKQTGYLFWYEDDLIKNIKGLDINISNATLTQAMDASIKGQRLEYSINERTIMVRAKKPSLINPFIQSLNVNGKVVDENGQPLPGATIKVKQSGKQTSTNTNGEFYLDNVPDDATIEISFIGYVAKELRVQSRMLITLVAQSENLQEVQINAGYYTIKNRERTGSISKVDSKTIGQQPVSNPLAALIGRMPGVNIEQQSGINGGGFKIEIRGQNSLRNTSTDNGNSPLYLIDGVPFPAQSMSSSTLGIGGLAFVASPLNVLNPNDIESIEILKDADATAIYGSRGANGVILITTKKSKLGNANYQVTFQQGASQISRMVKYMNTDQYLTMRDEAFKNDGVAPNATQYDVNGTWNRNRYTNWQKELIGGTAHNTSINASINGGSENTQYSVTGNYNRNTTVLPVEFADKKANASLSLNHTSFNKKFSAAFYASYSVGNNNLPKEDLTTYINLPPNAPELYNPDGSLNWGLNSSNATTWNNPLSSTLQPYIGRSNSLISSGRLRYQIIEGLRIESTFGYNSTKLKESLYLPIVSLAPSPSATGANRIAYNNIDTWIIEPQVRYNNAIGKGKIDVLVGSTFQSTDQATELIAGSGYTSDLLIKSVTAAPTRIAANTSSQYRYAAVFGRFNYIYDNKYIVNLTARRDGSSRFGPDRQFANFGAIAAAWLFSEETLFKNAVPFISNGKVRASYGITGSDQIPDYGYLETYSATNPYIDGTGLFPSQLANPDYSWEKTRKFEAALEVGLLQDKIFISSAFYKNRSSNQLVGYRLPDITGFASIQYNLQATVQNTGWEFELLTKNITKANFTWSTSINLTLPESKLISYPGLAGSSYATTYTVGAPLNKPRLYRYIGVDPNTGAYKFVDLDNNGSMTTTDRQLAIKNFTATLFGGIQNTISYKDFSIDFLVQCVKKTVKSPYSTSLLPGTMINQPTEVLDRWQQPGDITSFARFSQINSSGSGGTGYQLLNSSDRYTDASFVRLKNVSVSYSLPKDFLKRANVTGLRFFVQGQNLFTISKYPGDPEVANLRVLPTLKTISAGMSMSL